MKSYNDLAKKSFEDLIKNDLIRKDEFIKHLIVKNSKDLSYWYWVGKPEYVGKYSPYEIIQIEELSACHKKNSDESTSDKTSIYFTKNQLSDLGRTIALACTIGVAETTLDDGRRVYVNFGENYNLSQSIVNKGKIYLYGSKEDVLNINKGLIEAYKHNKAEISDSFMTITFLIKD